MIYKIEYYGEILNLNEISIKEGLDKNKLGRLYKEKQDIYEAVRICKERQKQQSGYIEYNGEMLTIYKIAKREGLNDSSLGKLFKDTGDIYEAVRIAKENQNRAHLNVEYNGKKHSITEIAVMEGINPDILSKRYKEKGDIYEAIRVCKENKEKNAKKSIEYDGEIYDSIRKIAQIEGISAGSLSREYSKSGDIYEAVKICKERADRKHGTIEYKGKVMTISAIAKSEKLTGDVLMKKYREIGDIYKAVEECKKSQSKRKGDIEYNGSFLTITAIADLEKIRAETLKVLYKEIGDIYKSVFICKTRQINLKRKKEKINTAKYGEVSLYDLSLILGIKYNELTNLINKGHSVDEIIKMNLKPTRSKESFAKGLDKLENGQSLREYCIEHKLNYSCIYRAMITYGKSLEEAEEYYNKNGQQIPTTWIYEKYSVLLRHLMIKDKIDIDRVIKYMREDVLSMEEAVEKYIIRKNAQKEKLDLDWMEELYDVLTDVNIASEYDEYKKNFYVEEKEEECIINSYDEVENFKRKLLLFEISEALEEKIFTPEEEKQVLKAYDITPEEIRIIFTELYSRFNQDGVLMGKNQQIELSEEEKEVINQKIQKYTEMISESKQDSEILRIMKSSVGKNVGKNEETRQELNKEINKDKNKEQK